MTEPQFVICPCRHCNGKIEFDASRFEKGETRAAECPHCHMETLLFIPQVASIVPTVEIQKPPVMPNKPRPAAPAANRQFKPLTLAEIMKWVVIGWTVLCAVGFGWGFMSVLRANVMMPPAYGNEDMRSFALLIALIMGAAMWFGIWALIAVPSLAIWLVSKKKSE